ncbi:MAG: glycosyltransferase family 39 protein [Desulfomonilaceae bacterium]
MSFSSSQKSLVPALVGIGIIGLYYAFGLARCYGFAVDVGFPTYVVAGRAECLFMFCYVVCAAYASAFISLSLVLRDASDRFWSEATTILTHKYFPAAAAIFGFVGMVLVRFFLFERFPLTDDENVYVFVAKTLLAGRLSNPAPEFYELFKYPLMIVTQHQWMGEYTIGHPLFLALGLLTGLKDFIVPAASAGTLLLIYFIAKDQFGRKVAVIALLLAVLSPQFILTGGTLLGYPTAGFCSAVMIFSVLRLHRRSNPYWILIFLCASSLLILNRPQSWLCLGVPLGLFSLVSAIKEKERALWRAVGIQLAVAVASSGVFLLANYWHTGDPFKTAQYLFLEHSKYGKSIGFYVRSIAGIHTPLKGVANLLLSLLRQNVWLFGWPFSFVFILFVPAGRFVRFLLGWGLAYWAFYTSFFSPGINIPGPVYYYEMILPAAILSACGIVRLHKFLECRFADLGRKIVPGVILASYIVSCLMFLPVVLTSLREITLASSTVYRALDEHRVHDAVIFVDDIVPNLNSSWVFAPYVSGPDTEREDRIFVRWPKSPKVMKEFLGKYPNRQVWGVRPEENKRLAIWRMK